MIFIPESASGPKRKQIEAYGAELVPIPGSRADVAKAVKKAIIPPTVYASHAYLPFNLPGYATAAYEIVDQLGKMPGAVILPTGQGGFLLGLARGFAEIGKANAVELKTQIIGVQAKACSPLWDKFTATKNGIGSSADGTQTLAEGVRVSDPLRANAVVDAVKSSNGSMQLVDEDEILPSRNSLAQLGFYVEPTSAIVWPVLSRLLVDLPDPIVLILTGSGLKYG